VGKQEGKRPRKIDIKSKIILIWIFREKSDWETLVPRINENGIKLGFLLE
jgi:hypothetical protein